MIKNLPLKIIACSIIFLSACSHKNYISSVFEQRTASHRKIAILPPEMVFTGTQPKGLSAEDIVKIEESESRSFHFSLYNGILRHANTRKYYTAIQVQDISTTQNILEKNGISLRSSWKEDDKKLAELLGVDAVVRMRVQKKRYMSDLASMGIDYGRQILYQVGAANKLPLPHVSNKTNDIYASCSVVSENISLWNDSYEGRTNYNVSSETVINDITDSFGKRFPYRKRR